MKLYQRVMYCHSRWTADNAQVWEYKLECGCTGTKLKRKVKGTVDKPAPVRIWCRRHPVPQTGPRPMG